MKIKAMVYLNNTKYLKIISCASNVTRIQQIIVYHNNNYVNFNKRTNFC